MLAENLKALRKAKGLSQEELAARLHVVRQTVSKWEKGRSVPDADLLIRLAEELDTTSAALLGPEVPPEAERGGTAEQLARIAEQLAVKNRRARRIWRIVAGVLIAFVMVNLLLILLSFAAFRSFQAEAESTVQAQELPQDRAAGHTLDDAACGGQKLRVRHRDDQVSSVCCILYNL